MMQWRPTPEGTNYIQMYQAEEAVNDVTVKAGKPHFSTMKTVAELILCVQRRFILWNPTQTLNFKKNRIYRLKSKDSLQ